MRARACCTWFFAKDKTAGEHGSIDRTGQVLFIDARNLGHMIDRAERALSDNDIALIADTFHAWRGMPMVRASAETQITSLDYADVAGFAYSATLAEIKAADYALTPGRYVGASDVEDDAEPIQEKIARLSSELSLQFDESTRLSATVLAQLDRL